MSEFSDCYYLLDATREQVVSLIKQIRRYGMVWPKRNRYVPFLVDGVWDAGRLVDAIVQDNPGVMVHYSYAEDYGLCVTVYNLSNLAFTIEIDRCGPSANDIEAVLLKVEELSLVGRKYIHELRTLLVEADVENAVDLTSIRARLSKILGITCFSWTSCADLSIQTQKEISRRFPEAVFVLKNQRGKPDTTVKPSPNQWCFQPGLPAFMYLPVPSGPVDENMLERHFRHWIETRDWDEDRQAGFWLYTAYRRALPNRMGYLADRMMNLSLAFDAALYEAKLRQTLAGILTVADADFDWEPYLSKLSGEQRL